MYRLPLSSKVAKPIADKSVFLRPLPAFSILFIVIFITITSLIIRDCVKDAEEEELWQLFEPCGKILSVRLIRDAATGIGKGFGYINFEDSDSVELALQMESPTLKGRELRVSVCNTNMEKKKKNVSSIWYITKKVVTYKIDKKAVVCGFFKGCLCTFLSVS